MVVTQRLQFRQSQSLAMTPQLQQAIKLLQLSNLELNDYLESELEQNPLLEREGPAAGGDRDALEAGAGTGGEDEVPGADDEAGSPPDSPPDSDDLATAETLPAGDQAPLDTDFDGDGDDWPVAPTAFERWGEGGGAYEGGREPLDQRLSREPSLRDRLLEQLQMDLDGPTDRIIGVHLIDQLDEAGYLTADLDPLADLLGCERARIESALARMQRFEPTGIFARDLRECLALQLTERDRLDPAMATLLDNLDLLARRDKAQLKRLCGVDDEDLSDMVAEIKALNPKPAAAFDYRVAEPVVPDILVRRRAGGWFIELNSETLPRVLVNRDYYAQVSAEVRGKAERAYLADRLQSANWLVKALHQRATTILKVAEEIVRQQEDFLRKGLQYLRPLTLQQIADAIDMHESTVSRVTTNKYMSTPRGMYELKYFFTSSIAGVGDAAAHSAEAVRQRIKDLIDAETADGVLSDDSIVERLRADGIDIARRTVAKYREAMRIPSSVQRRRDKALSL
jgi:RNA polymerase sigma-54 factor